MTRLLLAIAFVTLLPWSALAQSQPAQCNTRDVIVGLLSEKYSELPVAVGLANNGGLVEVLSSSDGSTWSIIITSPKGMSCLVAAGEAWQSLSPEWKAKGDPL